MDESAVLVIARAAMTEQRYSEAEDAASRILRDSPSSSEALRVMAEACLKQGKTAAAIPSLKMLAKIEPNPKRSITVLASVYWQMGEWQESAKCCAELLVDDENNRHALSSLGLCHLAMSETEDAISCFERAVRGEPPVAAFHHNFALALERAGRLDVALEQYGRAIDTDPNAMDSLSARAELRLRLGAPTQVIDDLERLKTMRPLSAADETHYAGALLALDRLDDAQMRAEEIKSKWPNHVGVYSLLGTILQRQGLHVPAEENLRRAVALDPSYVMPYWQITQGRKIKENDRALIRQMEDRALAVTSIEDKIVINFALGKALDDLGDYEKAMARFDEANHVQKSTLRSAFDPAREIASVDRIIQAFRPELLHRLRTLANEAELPLFVVGMYRSGTTITEQALSSHPQVFGAGELAFWPEIGSKIFDRHTGNLRLAGADKVAAEYLALLRNLSKDSLRVIDKHPLNYRHVGVIHALLPNARFVFCTRDPVDTCLSIYMTYFRKGTDFMHDKANLAVGYREHLRLLDHWRQVLPKDRYLDLKYEDFVEQTEAKTRALVDFAGLPWHEACLHPERNDRVVTTASQWQVRQPVYRSSLDRASHYKPWLGELTSLRELS